MRSNFKFCLRPLPSFFWGASTLRFYNKLPLRDDQVFYLKCLCGIIVLSVLVLPRIFALEALYLPWGNGWLCDVVWLVELDTVKIKSKGFRNKTIGFKPCPCHLLCVRSLASHVALTLGFLWSVAKKIKRDNTCLKHSTVPGAWWVMN